MPEMRVGGWSGIENRKHRRVPLRVPIECSAGSSRAEGQAENISISGLLVRCREPFEQDAEISVAFTLPGAPRAIRSKARVAHVVPGNFMGLELNELSMNDRAEIDRFIAAAPLPAKLESQPK